MIYMYIKNSLKVKKVKLTNLVKLSYWMSNVILIVYIHKK
jgi:hypothetical protein